MADIINFPDENKRLLESGKQKIKNQDFLAAKDDFEKLYQQKSTFFYAKKLISVLQNLGDYASALQLADDHFTAFMNDAEGFTTYFHLLLLDTQFLAAHKLLYAVRTPEKHTKLQEELEQLENAQSLLSADLKVAKKKQLTQLDETQRPIEPKDWQALVKGISLADFLTLCQEYLSNAKNPFIPPKLIEELVQDGAKEIINFHDQKVNLMNLALPEESEILNKILAIVEEKTQNNPQLQLLIIPEVKAHFALMYPFLPDEKQSEDWAESYLLEYKAMFGESICAKPEEKYPKIQEKKQKIRQIYEGLDKGDRN